MSIKKSPVYNVIAVPVEKVQANDYNPNVVAPPEMRLLELSIWEDGFTMPCVCYYDKEKDVIHMELSVSIDQNQLKELLLQVGLVRPVFIWGAPGIGKSAIVEQFAA